MAKAFLTVEDFRRRAKRRLPRVAFDFIDGAAESEQTMRRNLAAFNEVSLRPRNGTRVGIPDLRTTILGQELSMPLALAPCGMARVVHPLGDLAAARAAGAAGTAFTLSTMSGHRLEEIAVAASGPLWYQVYDVGGRPRVEQALGRAAVAGYRAIMVTLDTQVSAGRLRDARNGTAVLLGPNGLAKAPYLPQMLRTPRWLAHRVADGLVPRVPNVLQEDGSPEYLWKNVRPYSLAWEDFSWVRECWSGPIMVKGVLTAEDARRARDLGVDAVVVSNHGGRQLDGVHATLEVLPEVVAAVGGQCEVLVDGGIRRGNDIVKALALGARAALIGRPWMYALGGAGEAGIVRLLDILRNDLIRDLQLMGCAKVSELTAEAVSAPEGWFHRAARRRPAPGAGRFIAKLGRERDPVVSQVELEAGEATLPGEEAAGRDEGEPLAAGAPAPLRWRGDIQGLRGVAILAVVVYHAAARRLPGGFIGVDVFFVISGFLITSLLVRELEQTGRISLRRFYAGRIRRLLPMAIVVIAATIIAADLLQSPLDAARSAKDGLASALYVANYRFALEQTNYLNAGLAPSPFEHYWSLGVEEQMYVVWPLVLLLGAIALRRRRTAHGAVAVLFVGTVASFVACVRVTHADAPWAFFSFPTRAWELGVGGLLAFAVPALRTVPRFLASLVGLAGLGAILYSAFAFGATTPWPGSAAAVPVLGAAAVIGAGCARGTRLSAHLLAFPPLQFAGKISYPWYLWHWPLLILAPLALKHSLSDGQALVLVGASALLATASHYLIERPIRTARPGWPAGRAEGCTSASA